MEQTSPIGIFRRGFATMIDVFISGFIRVLSAQILWNIWLKGEIENFYIDFENKFNTNIIGGDLTHINFMIHPQVTKSAIIFALLIFLVGALYHAFLDSSPWRTTIGKRLMKIIVLTEDGKRLSFLRALIRYCLSVVPWIFMIHIVIYTGYNKLSLYNALTQNHANLFFGIITMIWIQIPIVTKKKITTHDLLCETVLQQGDFKPLFKRSK